MWWININQENNLVHHNLDSMAVETNLQLWTWKLKTCLCPREMILHQCAQTMMRWNRWRSPFTP